MNFSRNVLLLISIGVLIALAKAKSLPDQIVEATTTPPISNSDKILKGLKAGVSKIGESLQKATSNVQSGFKTGINYITSQFTKNTNETVENKEPLIVEKEQPAIVKEINERTFAKNNDFAFEDEENSAIYSTTTVKSSGEGITNRVILDSPTTCKKGESLFKGKCRSNVILRNDEDCVENCDEKASV